MGQITEKKIVNAIKYFVRNTNNIGLTKLFKLLYFLDLMYFKKHGLKVTLLDYFTYDFGPVPAELYKQISSENLPDFITKEIKFTKEPDDDELKNPRYKIILKNPKIDMSCFTPYERKILEEVSYIYKDVDANLITEISHFKNQPWDLTKKNKGMYKLIDFELAIDEESTMDIEEIREYITLQKELKINGRI
ncbi:MAG: Panacea domain-containing protein [FCB group bacterium]|jgi:uncharacterized phage-associated protein